MRIFKEFLENTPVQKPKNSIFTFSYPCNGREGITFEKIFEMEVLMDLHVRRSTETNKPNRCLENSNIFI